jgi:uncharacterized protein (TIGR02444 family)
MLYTKRNSGVFYSVTNHNPTFTDDLDLSCLPKSLPLDNPFWQFSLSLWQQDGVQESLLKLQDQHEWLINRVLFSCWCGLHKTLPTEMDEALLIQATAWQRQWVNPLRERRHQLNTEIPWHQALKKQLQHTELLSEQIEQAILYASWSKTDTSTAPHMNTIQCVVVNLLDYIKTTATPRPLASGIMKELTTILKACLPTHEIQRLESYLSALNM